MVPVAHGSCGGDGELDRPVLLLRAPHQVTFLPGLTYRLVNAVILQELAVALANFLFDMALPEVGGETEGTVWLFVDGDVVMAFQPNDKVAFDLVFVVAPGFGILEQGQAKLVACGAQSVDVFDLCFDCCEVTHFSFRSDLLCVVIEGFGNLSM